MRSAKLKSIILVTWKVKLTLNAPIATKVVCFSRLLKCLTSLYGNSVDPDQTAPTSILNSSVMLGNYLQQTTLADDIFRCIFFLGALRVKITYFIIYHYCIFIATTFIVTCFKLPISLKSNLLLCWHGFYDILITWPHIVYPRSDSTELGGEF